ncbi:FRG1-like family-domain-containing protein [Usnea florida]
MLKPLVFKGERKPKKRKSTHLDSIFAPEDIDSKALTIQNTIAEAEQDDSWVTAEAATDVTGPIIFALPSTRPTCIACDPNGKVFTSELENIIESDLATAEPHDVRQVWIANRVAGTDEISFKGHHGRYLSCDKIGLLSATREAISPEESFLCIPSPDTPGTFSVQTVREKFLVLVADSKVPEIRGDAESVSFNTSLRIRMQARFKPRLKANKESKTREKVSRKELEQVVGRKLEEDEVRRLKKARVQGDYHEAILDVRVKGKHDKYS